MLELQKSITRRDAVKAIGQGSALLASSIAIGPAAASATAPVTAKSGKLAALVAQLVAAPRRRSFDTVPLIVAQPADWDHEAAHALLAYAARPVQAWDNADLGGPWLGLMREATNGETLAHGHPDFLAVSATHGLAHLALFSQAMWDKYGLAQLTDGKFTANTLIVEHEGVSADDPLQKPDGFYGPANNNIVSLQKRGAVFVACHDSIHFFARKLHESRADVPVDRIAADLTNNLIPGAVLVPSVVAFLAELQRAGYSYVKT